MGGNPSDERGAGQHGLERYFATAGYGFTSLPIHSAATPSTSAPDLPLACQPDPSYMRYMSGYYDGGHPMLPPNTPMFDPNDGGPARIAPSGGRTWKDDRADELRRRAYNRFCRIIFPPPIPILWFPPLAWSEEVGYGPW